MASEPTRNFGNVALQLADEIRKDLKRPVEQGPATKSTRQLYWLVGSIVALAVAAVEISVVMESDADIESTPAAALAVYQTPCALRMAAITDAITAYATAMGQLPPDLNSLRPAYLTVAPVDPDTGQPYHYERVGDGVALSCPNPAHYTQGPPGPG
ncbi:MAG: hypothetical protein HYR72_15630 [Deltaproteobacteria bacterium]|nr:hypothetical protein [Deltaproteobacteria bacterium]MBI3387401.1 hypothetical protein [Deltaproteobacteria bacterium]